MRTSEKSMRRPSKAKIKLEKVDIQIMAAADMPKNWHMATGWNSPWLRESTTTSSKTWCRWLPDFWCVASTIQKWRHGLGLYIWLAGSFLPLDIQWDRNIGWLVPHLWCWHKFSCQFMLFTVWIRWLRVVQHCQIRSLQLQPNKQLRDVKKIYIF